MPCGASATASESPIAPSISLRYAQAMDDEVQVQCPYCFQWQLLVVDPQTRGVMIQDCDVCCRPWRVYVERDADGRPHVSVERS